MGQRRAGRGAQEAEDGEQKGQGERVQVLSAIIRYRTCLYHAVVVIYGAISGLAPECKPRARVSFICAPPRFCLHARARFVAAQNNHHTYAIDPTIVTMASEPLAVARAYQPTMAKRQGGIPQFLDKLYQCVPLQLSKLQALLTLCLAAWWRTRTPT